MQGTVFGNTPASAVQGGHVLIVDDDQEVRGLLSTYLSRNGLRVGAFPDGSSLRRFLAREQADVGLVVLDVMLPVEDGFSICKWLKRETDLPVLMLSARVDEVDRVLGFELGADDYVCKPFSPRELLARIQRLLRLSARLGRPETEPVGRRWRFHGWVLDTTQRALFPEQGDAKRLSGCEFTLLNALVTNANRVMSRRTLAQLTQGRDLEPHDRSIDVLISRLRQLLGDDARDSRIIRTVYGRGYLLSGEVQAEASAPA